MQTTSQAATNLIQPILVNSGECIMLLEKIQNHVNRIKRQPVKIQWG